MFREARIVHNSRAVRNLAPDREIDSCGTRNGVTTRRVVHCLSRFLRRSASKHNSKTRNRSKKQSSLFHVWQAKALATPLRVREATGYQKRELRCTSCNTTHLARGQGRIEELVVRKVRYRRGREQELDQTDAVVPVAGVNRAISPRCRVFHLRRRTTR